MRVAASLLIVSLFGICASCASAEGDSDFASDPRPKAHVDGSSEGGGRDPAPPPPADDIGTSPTDGGGTAPPPPSDTSVDDTDPGPAPDPADGGPAPAPDPTDTDPGPPPDPGDTDPPPPPPDPGDGGSGGGCTADSECTSPFNCCDTTTGKCGLDVWGFCITP